MISLRLGPTDMVKGDQEVGGAQPRLTPMEFELSAASGYVPASSTGPNSDPTQFAVRPSKAAWLRRFGYRLVGLDSG